VCFALGEAHRAGIVHRDVKPSNIFLHRAATGQVPKVLDFGIATIVGDAALSQSLTLDGSLLGTPAYMAPERFRARSYGGQSDVYSVGIMLFQMLAGRLPFVTPHGDPMAVAMMQANDPPPSLRQINPAVPAAVERLVSLALRKSPEERPSADELGRSLAAAADLVVGRDLPVSSARPPIAVRPGSAQALTLRAGPYPPEAAVTPRPPARPARPPGARRPR
jgi:serine/threonine-protein kinase